MITNFIALLIVVKEMVNVAIMVKEQKDHENIQRTNQANYVDQSESEVLTFVKKL